MKTTTDIIVIGAGIIGAACAHEAASAGLSVTVVDRGPVGGETTGTGMGHLVVMDDSPAQLALTSYSQQLWLALAEQLPPNAEFDPCGTLWVAADEAEMAAVHQKAERLSRQNIPVEVVPQSELQKLEPQLSPDLLGGLRLPRDAVLYPPTAAHHLLHRPGPGTITLQLGQAVQSLEHPGQVTLADGSHLTAAAVINAAGNGASQLTPGLPVRPRKGHLAITDRFPGFVRHQIIELGYLNSAGSDSVASVAFNIQPRKTGQMLIGSSRQYGAEDKHVEPGILNRMLTRAKRYLPSLGQLSLTRIWTGHRPATPDKLPLIGPHPSRDRLWIAAGHEGLGITTCLATGRLLIDQILGRAPAIPVEPYSPARPGVQSVHA